MNSLPDDDQKQKQGKGKGLFAGKERVEMGARNSVESPIEEYTRKVDLEPEVEGWLEKIEKEDVQLDQPVMDEKGQIVLDDSQKQKKKKFKMILPMTQDEVEKGLHNKIVENVRWLAEWCIRMIKMFHGSVAYKKDKKRI